MAQWTLEIDLTTGFKSDVVVVVVEGVEVFRGAVTESPLTGLAHGIAVPVAGPEAVVSIEVPGRGSRKEVRHRAGSGRLRVWLEPTGEIFAHSGR